MAFHDYRVPFRTFWIGRVVTRPFGLGTIVLQHKVSEDITLSAAIDEIMKTLSNKNIQEIQVKRPTEVIDAW